MLYMKENCKMFTVERQKLWVFLYTFSKYKRIFNVPLSEFYMKNNNIIIFFVTNVLFFFFKIITLVRDKMYFFFLKQRLRDNFWHFFNMCDSHQIEYLSMNKLSFFLLLCKVSALQLSLKKSLFFF